MRRQRMTFKGLVLIAVAFAVWGCSRTNEDATVLDPSGKHPADWLVQHRASFLGDKSRCLACHGSDLKGGISKVSCFTPLFNGQSCHANGPSGHPAGWINPSQHGDTAKSQPGLESGFASCQNCHGADFSGGVSGVSCFSASTPNGACHVRNGVPVGAPHSPLPWRSYPSPTHTTIVDDAAGLNAAVCALCHRGGKNLRTPIITTYAAGTPGCFNSTLCHGAMGHPLGWAQPKFHGASAKANLTYCQQCHGDKPLGGAGSNPRFNVKVGRLVNGCEDCHAPNAAHPRVLQIPAIFGTITTLTPLGTPWYRHRTATNFDACNRCHGANLDGVGGVTGATACTFCHGGGLPTTLKNCTSCHGQPPTGTVYPNIAAAHPRHSDGTASAVFGCGECHTGLGTGTLDHFLRAKAHTTSVQAGAVAFGAFSKTLGVSPAYNGANQQCTNTYCHGVTLSGGSNKSPTWNDPNYLAAGCGTCHGFPPPNAAHTSFTSSTPCKSCHTEVNAANNGFDDPTKHVNGRIDVSSAHAFPYPGSAHMTAAGSAPFAGCVTGGCHTNSNAQKGVYPVTPGTPPDCQGCHTKLSPGNGCGSCHGPSGGNGRPNASTFPDVAGGHGVGEHNVACSTCHGSAGTGQTSNGPNDRTAHNDANVVVQLPGGITYTRSGLGDGHGTCTGSCNSQSHSGFPW